MTLFIWLIAFLMAHIAPVQHVAPKPPAVVHVVPAVPASVPIYTDPRPGGNKPGPRPPGIGCIPYIAALHHTHC